MPELVSRAQRGPTTDIQNPVRRLDLGAIDQDWLPEGKVLRRDPPIDVLGGALR